MNQKRPSTTDAIQLELFSSTKQLNISEYYESIPKEVAPNDPAIVWNGKLAFSVEKTFTVDGELRTSEIYPAEIKDPKTGEKRHVFPHFRELRIEYALISLASKQYLAIDYDQLGIAYYTLSVTFYQIQKEIVDAINAQEGRNLKPNDCPYNTTSIREGLDVLGKTKFVIHSQRDNKPADIINRLVRAVSDTKRAVVTFGPHISKYIKSGDWNVVDAHSILASKTYYTMKLKTLLHLKFRYAKKGAFYNPSLSLLMEKIGFNEYSQMRHALRRMTELLESLPEVDHVDVIQKKEGKKIVDAVYHIFPSESFVTSMIGSNILNKRAKTALVDHESEQVLIEPLERDFPSRRAYEKAKFDYDVRKGKHLFAGRHLSSK